MMEDWKRIVLRAAGFGAGFAVAVGIVVGVALWWSTRPVKAKPMNSHSIVGSYSGMGMQVRGDAMHLTVTYGLHNTTDKDYSLPTIGELMIVNPENKGLDSLEGFTWDSTTIIPAGQTANLKFDIPYPLSSYNKTAADLTDDKVMVDFIEKRLKEIDGFKFFDYGNRYEIDLPKWPVTDQTP
jgi:hypothetical protein